MSSQPYVHDLLQSLARAVPALLAIGEETSRRRAGPDKWSPREVVGHLIDGHLRHHLRQILDTREHPWLVGIARG